MHDIEAGRQSASNGDDAAHPEKTVPTHEQGRGPAAATASGGDALSSHHSPRHSRQPQNGDANNNVSIINGELDESGAEKSTIVDWEGPDDPLNPINFTETKKWVIMTTIGTATLACTCASSMVASTYEGMMEDFNISREAATLSLTMWVFSQPNYKRTFARQRYLMLPFVDDDADSSVV